MATAKEHFSMTNVTLDHSIRTVHGELLDRDSKSPSVECIIDATKVIRMSSNIQFKERHYIAINGWNQVPKDICDYTNIVMDQVDNFLVDFCFNDL